MLSHEAPSPGLMVVKANRSPTSGKTTMTTGKFPGPVVFALAFFQSQ
jgi:hypothetical protein